MMYGSMYCSLWEKKKTLETMKKLKAFILTQEVYSAVGRRTKDYPKMLKGAIWATSDLTNNKCLLQRNSNHIWF